MQDNINTMCYTQGNVWHEPLTLWGLLMQYGTVYVSQIGSGYGLLLDSTKI